MMNRHIQVLAAFVACVVFTGCRDSHDKLMTDQIEWIDDIAVVFNAVADNDLSAKEAMQQIKELRREGDAFMERKAVLNKDLTEADANALMEKYSRPMTESLGDVMRAVQKARKAGKLNRELQDAFMEMKLF